MGIWDIYGTPNSMETPTSTCEYLQMAPHESAKSQGEQAQLHWVFQATGLERCDKGCFAAMLSYKQRTESVHGGFHKWGTPKWMVHKGKSPSEMDDLGVPGYPYFRETPT